MARANPAAIKGSLKTVPKGKRNGDIVTRNGRRYRVVSYRHPYSGKLVRYLQAVTKCGSPAKKASCKTRVTKRRNPYRRIMSKASYSIAATRDINGNKRIRLTTNRGSFSIQSNRNLPWSHHNVTKGKRLTAEEREKALVEIVNFVQKYGTRRQREIAGIAVGTKNNPYASAPQPCHLPVDRDKWRSGYRHQSQGRTCVIQRTRDGKYISMAHEPLTPPIKNRKKGSTFNWGGRRWTIVTRRTRAGGYRRVAKEI